VLRYLIYSLRIRRVEYRIAELPIFLIPVLLTVTGTAAFRSAAFWEGLLIFLFLFAYGDLLNCLADRDLDAVYKPHLTEAVYGLGTHQVILQAAFSAAAALGLAAHLSWLLDRWVLLPMVVAGLLVGAAYSLEPVRLKGRGLWQLVFYWPGLFTGPMLFAAMLFSPWPPAEVIAVAAAYGMMQTGVLLVNTAEDFPEDREMGVNTVILALGLRRGIESGVFLTIGGATGLVAVFLWIIYNRHLPSWTQAALLPLATSGLVVSVSLGRLLSRMTSGGGTEEHMVREVKASGRWVPAWITSLALSTLAVAAAIWWATR